MLGSFYAAYVVAYVAGPSGVDTLLANATSDGGEGVSGIFVKAAASALAALVAWAVTAIARRFGVALKKDQKDMIRAAAREAILFAAERAAVEKKLHNATMSGRTKLAVATGRLLDKVPGISRAEAEKIVSENLASVGEGALVAVGKTVEAATN